MIARGSQQFTSEDWNGFWGTDARYYARRSDGAYFVIERDAMVFDLAGTTTTPHAQRVTSLPHVGRSTMRMLVARSLPTSVNDASENGGRENTVAPNDAPRVFACGVRRRFFR